MAEPVRLVVWDLDGTFWAGTLTEGGHTYNDANHNIVVELARRGIVSSICSKNDFDAVKGILVEKGIWDYFVFPSINWKPKGPRLKQLVEDVQLRPETVLLLDDNVLNLREAEHFVPGLQTADEGFISKMLDSPLFGGKHDPDLTRLKQYKLLETRKADEAVADDNVEFLRSCNIRVIIEYDVEKHIDRAIELINRTNQLNFTKNRLPEDARRARKRFKDLLGRLNIQAGLIRVKDRYGDYGYCGLYVMRTRKGQSELVHFCFSCRILGMGVEAWLYERFGRPDLDVAGEVLTNLATAAVPDWIQISTPDDTAEVAVTRTSLPPVVIRGACAVSPLLHYFQMQAQEITGEFNTIRDSVHHIRVDHSLMLRHALDGVSPAQMKILQELGFEAEDFQTRFNGPQGVRILSSWVDVQPIVYRHKATGLMVPYKVKIGTEEIDPMIDPAPGTPEFEDMPERAQNALRYLRNNFEHIGVLPPETLQQNFEIISAFVSDGSLMFALLAQETKKRDERGTELNRRIQQLNEIIHRVAARNPRIIPIGISEMASEEERRGRGHFHRSVYHRLYGEITARVATEFARNANAQTAVNLKEPDPVRIDQPPPHPTSTVHIPEVRILRDTF